MKKVFEFNEIKNELKEVEDFLSDYVNFSHPNLKLSSQHMLQAGGKRIRPAFVLLSGRFFNPDNRINLIPLAAAVELIHMATLVHDDVIDKADTRRGKPTIRVIWGNKFSLHAGDYLFAQALKLIDVKHNLEIAKVLAKVSVEMCQGEIQQLISTFDTRQSIKDYFYRIKRKTALLLAASCQIGAIATNAPLSGIHALYKYGYYLGMAFQIKDDVLDIQSTSKTLGKPAGSDLIQGIITLPTIMTLQRNNSDSIYLTELINNNFPNGQEDVDKAINIIKKNNGIINSLYYSERFVDKAKKQLKFLPNCSTRKNLEQIANYITEREF